MTPRVISADWNAPANVCVLSTTRAGGVSTGAWSDFNLGLRCGDDESCVEQNRAILGKLLPACPQWLHQVHGTQVVQHDGGNCPEIEGDALVSFLPGQVCAVLTADCLPVVFCNKAGDRVGIAHAGWRGLANGILSDTIDALDEDPDQLMVWLGPAIGPEVYEVGVDVTEAFPDEFPKGFSAQDDRWLMNLYALARLKLESSGVHNVSGGGFCTLSEPQRFFSFRRDGVSGRMASLVWLEPV